MELILWIILAVLVAGFGLVFFLLKKQKSEPANDQSLFLLQNQVTEIGKAVDAKLAESTRLMQGQFSESSRVIKEITQELTRVNEGQKQVVSFADQMRNLQDILKNPKQRGILGEYSLEVLLQNFFPHSYERQYKFRDGSIVDFVIKIKDRLIPVDSKFSLENYQRILDARDPAERQKWEDVFRGDLKSRIDETAKYIKPSENTMEFAFMFIPAEAVYYDLLVNKIGSVKTATRDLIEYAMGEKKVVVVSPTSFVAYLQTVMQGLKAMQIEESAREIRKRVEDLGRHLGSYENYFKKIGTHLATTVNSYNSAYKELAKVDRDVLKISGKATEIEPQLVETPSQESEKEGLF